MNFYYSRRISALIDSSASFLPGHGGEEGIIQILFHFYLKRRKRLSRDVWCVSECHKRHVGNDRKRRGLFSLAHDEHGRGGKAVRNVRHLYHEFAPENIFVAAIILNRRKTPMAERDAQPPPAHGNGVRVRDDDS